MIGIECGKSIVQDEEVTLKRNNKIRYLDNIWIPKIESICSIYQIE
jgi:hypothetical protein